MSRGATVMCCNILQCAATYLNVLQRTLQCPAIRRRTPSWREQGAAVCCGVLRCIAACCSILQCVASVPPRVHTHTRQNTESVHVKNDPQKRPIPKKRDHETALVKDACNVKRRSLIYKLKRGGA